MEKIREIMLHWLSALIVALAFSWCMAWADDGFYVVAVGKRAKRTVLVSPQSTSAASGTALLNALAGITDASASNTYLIIIEPGMYNIGSNTFQMKPYVDVQGSGEITTKITGTVNSLWTGVVSTADNAELRFITVENTGGGTNSVAIYCASSTKMSNVTANASGGSGENHGVHSYNSGVTMNNVSASGSGGSYAIGVYIFGGSPSLINVKAQARFGVSNIGISCGMADLVMTNVSAGAIGGTDSYGVKNWNSQPEMINVVISAESATNNYGVYQDGDGATVKIDHSVISGSTNSVRTVNGGKASIANTKLEGGQVSGSGFTCVGAYDGAYHALSAACLP